MGELNVRLSLSYSGEAADSNAIDFYDAAQAMMGFQRTLALTTHFIINNEVITQAPSLFGAQIYCLPPESGSWKMTAVIATSFYMITTAPQETPLGHLVYSAYEYVVSASLGIPVDYSRSLGEIYREMREEAPSVPVIDEGRFDSLIEKCETSFKNMHRPIVKSESSLRAKIFADIGTGVHLRIPELNKETYEYINYSIEGDDFVRFTGAISSYNMNTYSGRIFIPDLQRTVSFKIGKQAIWPSNISIITESLSRNASQSLRNGWDIEIEAIPFYSRTDRVKYLIITDIKQL